MDDFLTSIFSFVRKSSIGENWRFFVDKRISFFLLKTNSPLTRARSLIITNFILIDAFSPYICCHFQKTETMIKAIQNILKTIVGDKAQNDLKKIRPLVDQVLAEDQKLASDFL